MIHCCMARTQQKLWLQVRYRFQMHVFCDASGDGIGRIEMTDKAVTNKVDMITGVIAIVFQP